MKHAGQLKLIFWVLLVLIAIGFVVLPPRTVNAEISGVLIRYDGVPIEGATVSRIGREPKRTKIGSTLYERTVLQVAISDEDGNYQLPEIRRPKGLPSILSLPWVHCYEELKVDKSGYATYKSQHGDPDLTKMQNEAGACNGVRFRKDIELVPNDSFKPTPLRGAA